MRLVSFSKPSFNLVCGWARTNAKRTQLDHLRGLAQARGAKVLWLVDHLGRRPLLLTSAPSPHPRYAASM